MDRARVLDGGELSGELGLEIGELLLLRLDMLLCASDVGTLPDRAIVGDVRYLGSCEEIYDDQVLSGRGRPGLLGLQDDTHLRALSTPDQTFWGAEP